MVNDGWLFEWLILSCFARQWDVGGGALVEEQAGLDMNTDKTDLNSGSCHNTTC